MTRSNTGNKVLPSLRQLHTLILLLLMMTGVSGAWGQTPTEITSLSSIGLSGDYVITADINASGFTSSIASFSGTLTARAKDDGTFPVISNLSVPIFTTATDATISNIMLKSISVSGSGPIGAVCGTANGTTRIYNCGVLPSLTNTGITYDTDGNITGFGSTVYSSNGNCGGLVGMLAGNARVINCFSYANITGITNTLNGCTIKESFYGGGNLANVNGNITSTLTDCTVMGNVFGGGFSGTIEPFRIHDRTKTEFPYIDKAGIMHNGTLYYVQDGTQDRYYTWCYRKSDTEFFPSGVIIPSTATTNNPTFQDADGNWHVLTTVSLEGLGAVSGNATLTINTTDEGQSIIGTTGDGTTGNVYGGGAESAVNGNTIVTLQGNTHVLGNVFGGGDQGVVEGSAEVKIED